MTNTTDFRTAQALNGIQRTSLSEFVLKEPVNETEMSDNTSADTTETVEESTEDVSNGDVGTSDGEQSTEESATAAADEPPADTTYEVKGSKVSVKDLLNAYETRQEISKRFDEVGKKEKRLQQERERIQQERAELDFINEKFEEVRECILKNDSLGAFQIIMTMASATDDSTSPGVQELLQQAINMAESFHEMSPEEQKLYIREQNIKRDEYRRDKTKKKNETLEEQRKLREYYDHALEVNSVTEEELDSTYEELKKQDKFKEELEKKDHKGRIAYCISWVLGKRMNNNITEGIKKVDPTLVENKQLRLALLDVLDPRCTVDDVSKAIKSYVDTLNKESVTVKPAASTQSVAPTKPTTSNRAPTAAPKTEKTSEPIRSWKDIIAKYS